MCFDAGARRSMHSSRRQYNPPFEDQITDWEFVPIIDRSGNSLVRTFVFIRHRVNSKAARVRSRRALWNAAKQAGVPDPKHPTTADDDIGPIREIATAMNTHEREKSDMEVVTTALPNESDRERRHADGPRPIETGWDSGYVTPLEAERRESASWAFTTRRVRQADACTLVKPKAAPRAGDLVLARVDAIGHHAGLQLVHGRKRRMFEGDEIIVAYGNRYACSQFEAVVPETLGPCHLVAGGGIAARAVSWHDRIVKGPTHITPIGLLGDSEGHALNLAAYGIEPRGVVPMGGPSVIAVLGTAMDSGKTQTAAFIVRGLISGRRRVAYAKVTGTGAGNDTWLLQDAGAEPVLDFTDAGLPTTYLASCETVERVLTTLVSYAGEHGVDAVVIEVADGVYQRETRALMGGSVFANTVGGVVVAARDAMGASAGVEIARDLTLPVLALSGLVSAAPLQRREAEAATGLPVFDRRELATPEVALSLLKAASRGSEYSSEPALAG